MAITFRSNRTASRYIKDVSGYSGPPDFTANVSFADELAVDSSWSPISLSEVLSTTRSEIASVLKSSNLNDYEMVGANELRVSFIPDYATKGVISSNWATSYLTSPLASTASLSAGNSVYSIFTTDDQGFVTLASNPNVDILSGAGTFSNPLYFRVTGSTTITVVRNAGASAVYLMNALNGQTPFIPNYEFIGGRPDSLMVSPSKIAGSEGCVVFRFASPKRRYAGYSEPDVVYPLFLLKQDANNYVAAYIHKDGTVTARLYANGSQVSVLAGSFSIDRDVPNTVGISWENGRISVSMNGSRLLPFNGRVMPSSFSVNSVNLAGRLETWVTSQSEMAVFNLVTYDRSLKTSELDMATNL